MQKQNPRRSGPSLIDFAAGAIVGVGSAGRIDNFVAVFLWIVMCTTVIGFGAHFAKKLGSWTGRKFSESERRKGR